MVSTAETDKLKATRTAKFSFSFQQQLLADQAAAARPDTKNAFRNRNDACKRLLRYHVFYQDDVPVHKVDQFDNDFETLSCHLLQRKEALYRRFQSHMLQLSMKESRPGENAMMNQMFVETETNQLKHDKEFVAQGGHMYLPPIPDHWKKMAEEMSFTCDDPLLDNESTRKRKCSESAENPLYSLSKRYDQNEMNQHDSQKLMTSQCLQSQPSTDHSSLQGDSSNANSVHDLNDFTKYLSSCSELGGMEDFGLYPSTSNADNGVATSAFGSIMGLESNQTDQTNDDSASANDFMLWRPEDAFGCDSNSNLDCKLDTNTTSNGISTSNWASSFANQTEDDVAVESILSGTSLPSSAPERNANPALDALDLHSLTGLPMSNALSSKPSNHLNDDDDDDDDEDDDEDEDEDDDNSHSLSRLPVSSAPSIFNGGKLTINNCSVSAVASLEHSAQLTELDHIDTSELSSDMQMESAINSILDILVPGGSTTGNDSLVQDQSNNAPSGLMHSNSSMSNNYAFGNIGASGNASSSYRAAHSSAFNVNSSSMPSMMNSQRTLIQDFGNDTVLDEAVKSILS
jgi:hypothetical protein